jgi:aldose 1-epimerase
VHRSSFGPSSRGPVQLLTLGVEPGPVLQLLDLGATVHRLEVTGGDGERRNVVLGHATPEEHLASTDYIGSTVGRYANRIAGGTFLLDGEQVRLGAHDRGNHLHGGPEGFDRRIWEVVDSSPYAATMRLASEDGDQGFPGNLEATVRFEVTDTSVRIGFRATTDAPTLANLTNHSYFNLDGEAAGTVDGHLLRVDADAYTPVDDAGIPLGGHASVADTPFDFREPHRIGAAIRENHDQVARVRGIDHNFVVNGTGLRTAAVLESPRTRTRLTLSTDQPGLQVYTGNFLDGTRRSLSGGLYRQGDGIALEPQLFPDTPNRPDFPSAVLRPGETYTSHIEWHFGGTAGS